MEIENEDRWYVQFDSQEVRLMTLEELDAAFQQGLIHENTYLIQVGSNDWQTLADVAGLSDSDADESAAPNTVEAEEAETAAPPVAHAAAASLAAARHESLALEAKAPLAPMNQVATPISTWPPVVSASSASYPPISTPAPSSPAPSLQNSVAPVVQDVGDLDLDAMQFKRSRKSLVFMAAAAIALVGGGAFALTRLDSTPQLPVAAAAPPAMAAALPVRRPFTEIANTPLPAAAPAPAAPVADGSPSTGRLSEDMKRALTESDKSRAETKKQKRSAAPRRSSSKSASSKSSGGSSVFRSGGNANDPLNSAL